MSDPYPSNSSELTVGALREWLNDQHRTNSKDRDYSAAIVRYREALTRIMEHYDFCKRLDPETQNASAELPPPRGSASTQVAVGG